VGIVVSCRCGQGFEADAWLAGKVVQCPVCRSPIVVPTPVADVEAPATYIPRPRTATKEEKETAESVTTLLVGGGIILVLVAMLSVFIVFYVRGIDPVALTTNIRNQGKLVQEPVIKGAPDVPSVAVPGATSTLMHPPIATPSGLPEGWAYHEHPAGRYSVLLPAAPEIVERKEEDLLGEKTFYTMVVSQDEHLFEVSRDFKEFNVIPDQIPTVYSTLVGLRQGEMDGGLLEGSNTTMVDGRLVCDAILRGKVDGIEYRKYIRLLVSGNYLFELSCRVPPGKERPTDIKLFLGNYRLQ